MQTNSLIDRHGRSLNYLRISITDRCNFKCVYCRRDAFTPSAYNASILSYEEILRLVRVGAALGIDKVRVTGGEPLVRRGLGTFIRQLATIPGIRDVSVTTNGFRLNDYLEQFQTAGIKRLNISLDSLDRGTYEEITGFDGFARVWRNLLKAMEMGFSPIKVNMVVLRGINDHEIPDFANLTRELPLSVRFIEYMPAFDPLLDSSRQILGPEIKQRLGGLGRLLPFRAYDSSNIAERFKFENAKGDLGLIRPVSKHFCSACNRLRLTSDGKLRPCLLSDEALDIRPYLSRWCDEALIARKIREAARMKPACRPVSEDNKIMIPKWMNAIGG